MRERFTEFEEGRYEWAFAAKHDFLSRFQLYDAKDGAGDPKQIVVSVYGPTQVGKTTLILNLLGVKEEAIENMATILRGKRDVGQSATVTVTRYRISDTEDYVVTLPGGSPEVIPSTDVLERRLAALRRDVENGSIDAIDPVVIALPKSCFVQSDVALEVLDLPGIESAEEREIQHVERCINHWIPNSQVCLIVNRASDLTFFRDIGISHLNHWYEYPDNFYVILTHAYSPESVKRRMRNNSIKNTADLRGYYDRELGDILGRTPGTVYPIELGASMERLDPAEREMAKTILVELKERIEQTDYRHVSFKFLTRYYAEIVRESEREIRRLTEEVEMAEHEQVKLEKQYQRALEKGEARRADFKKQTVFLQQNIMAFRDSTAPFIHQKRWEETVDAQLDDVQTEKSRVVLNNLFSTLSSSIEKQLQREVQTVNKLLSSIYLQIDAVSQTRFVLSDPQELDFSLWDDSKIDRYLSQKNYGAQMQRMKKSLLETVSETCQLLHNEARAIESRLVAMRRTLKDTSRRFDTRLLHERTALEAEIVEKKQDVVRSKNQLVETKAYWRHDVAHARQYQSFFKKHVLLRQRQLMQDVTSGSVEERYRAGLYLTTLGQDAEKIIRALEGQGGHGTD